MTEGFTQTGLTHEPAQVVNLVDRLFVFGRTLQAHGGGHPMARQAAAATLESLAAVETPIGLQFVAEGLFCDRVLVPLDAETFERVGWLGAALANLSVHEISFHKLPTVDDLLRFGIALARGSVGPSSDLDDLKLDGLTWREIPYAQRGSDSEAVDPEVFSTVQIAQAISTAEALAGDDSGIWDWRAGVGIVRRLVRTLASDGNAAARAVELAPGEWTVPRRAVSAALQLLRMLDEIGLTPATTRAGTHALLGLSLCGYSPHGAGPVGEAARELLGRFRRAPITGQSGIEPHRLRTTAVVHQLANDRGEHELEILGALKVAYELEAGRRPAGVDFELSLADLLAQLVTSPGSEDRAGWIEVLVHTVGEVPTGARVRLDDGRIGTVIGPGAEEDPWRPMVLVDGVTVVTDEAVQLLAPGAGPPDRRS